LPSLNVEILSATRAAGVRGHRLRCRGFKSSKSSWNCMQRPVLMLFIICLWCFCKLYLCHISELIQSLTN